MRIVDFEDAGRGDPAYELATLSEHLSCINDTWDGFLDRFDVDADRLLAACRVWAVLWLQLLLPGGPAAKHNQAEVRRAQAERTLTLLGC